MRMNGPFDKVLNMFFRKRYNRFLYFQCFNSSIMEKNSKKSFITLVKENAGKLTYTGILLLGIAGVSSSSCTSSRSTTAKSFEIYGSGVIQMPTIANLTVSSTRVTGSASGSESASIDGLKQEAIANALSKLSADVLVEPKFTVERSPGKTFVSVSGYPGTYNNFRPIEDGDIALLKAGILQKAEVVGGEKVEREKGSTGAVVGVLALLGLAALAAILAAGL